MTDILIGFAQALSREDRAANTIESYLRDLRHFAHWFAQANSEPFSPTAITPMDLKDYRRYLLVQLRAKPATVNRRLAALHRLCRWAKAKGLIQDDPSEGIKGVEKERRLAPKGLSRNQVHALLRTTLRHGSKRAVAIIQLLRNTGVRVGELVALRLTDVVISERKGKIVVRWGKGGRYREIDLNARQAIGDYLGVRPAVADDHLFIGQRGAGLTVRAVESLVAKYAWLAGLPEVTPHTLRHTFAKHLLDAGENLVTVATLMGHSRLDTTAVYTRPGAQDLERAVERLAEHE